MVHQLLNDQDIHLLISGKQSQPHKILGILPENSAYDRIVLFQPKKTSLFLEILGRVEEARHHHSGIFSISVAKGLTPADYRVYHHDDWLAHDPYAFPHLWNDVDSLFFHKGNHYTIYDRMGAIPLEHHGVQGVLFTVWAPQAKRVSVIGDFNGWQGLTHPLSKVSDQGVWELFIPGLKAGAQYQWEIVSCTDDVIVKSDPYGKFFEYPPQSQSVVIDHSQYHWQDSLWMDSRKMIRDRPLSIYEVHVGSWQWENGSPLRYKSLAKRLAAYCKEMHYTHVELLPITEHPLNESWGYQSIGYYAPTRRYGSPDDFKFFIDYLHNQGIGVILDWVPGHFPTDSFAMSLFDGSSLYEYRGQGNPLHPHWNTYTFDYRRPEVVNFLLGSALFWLDVMHIDGLRVDAVTSMLYLDYGREVGDWEPNVFGGNENLEAIRFLQHLTTVIHQRFPGVIICAEESSSFPKVTKPVEQGGLGFDYKWNLGWMHDTFRHIQQKVKKQTQHVECHKDLTFHLLYAFSESFILPFSHDEVVHGKGSLLAKCPGNANERFALLRLLLSYQICQLGKKLMFMGGEFAHLLEWAPDKPLDWSLLQLDQHSSLQLCAKELNAFYLKTPCLWKGEECYESFRWIDFSDTKNHVIAYCRFSSDHTKQGVLCIHHFGDIYFHEYILSLPHVSKINLMMNTDDARFGGEGRGFRLPLILKNNNEHACGLNIELPPLTTLVFSILFK